MTVGFIGLGVWWTGRVIVWLAIGVIVAIPLGLLFVFDELAGERAMGAKISAAPPAPPGQPVVAPAPTPVRLAA